MKTWFRGRPALSPVAESRAPLRWAVLRWAVLRWAVLRWAALSRDWPQLIATCLFVLPFFTAGVLNDSAKIQLAGFVVLTAVSFAVSRRQVPRGAVIRICLVAATLMIVLCAYLVFGSWPSAYGQASSYDRYALIFVATYVEVAAFAALFFDARIFERVVWRATTAALWVGVLSWLASRLAHHPILVSVSHGAVRMQGTLSEPSAWAPVIPVVLLFAIRRRSLLHAGLAVAGLLLTASPTCLLVLAVSLVVYYALTGSRRQRAAILVTLAVLIPASAAFVLAASPGHYLSSHNAAENAVGRLLAGIEDIDTGGRLGHNTRWASTKVIVADAARGGWLLTGAGPAADSTYLPARYPPGTRPQAYGVNALWVGVLFDFGVVGVAVLGAAMLVAARRMRHRPDLCAILLPFMVAAMVNSAEGSFAYVFVALSILLFAFGWAPPAAPDARAQVPGPMAAGAPLLSASRAGPDHRAGSAR